MEYVYICAQCNTRLTISAETPSLTNTIENITVVILAPCEKCLNAAKRTGFFMATQKPKEPPFETKLDKIQAEIQAICDFLGVDDEEAEKRSLAPGHINQNDDI